MLIFVTGHNERVIEDYFGSNLELEATIRGWGTDTEATMRRNIPPDGVQLIFIRQSES